MIRIAVDAMGGDNAPDCNIFGALDAVSERKDITVLLVGNEEIIKKKLSGETYDAERLQIVPASEVIETGDEPVMSIQQKKDSSLVVGMKFLRQKEADAFVSCGSTGALLVGGQVIAGRIKGVKRAPLAVILPTRKGNSLLIDCGANVDARPENLLQFAVMGRLYMKYICNIEDPTVGLLNIGVEEEKGNALTRETYQLLKEHTELNFIGNAEARDLPDGAADVIVTEAFAGNVALKVYEGAIKALMKEIKGALMSSTLGKLGGLMIKPSLKKLLKRMDSSEAGGAPLLGLTGLVLKAHGNSTRKEMKNAILQCIGFKENDLSAKIEEGIALTK